jgi:hypothetical protein
MSDLKAALSRHVQEQTPSAPPPFAGVDVRARRRSHRRIATIVTVPVVLAATVVSVLLAGEPPSSTPTAQAPASMPARNSRPMPAPRQRRRLRPAPATVR